MKAQKEDMGTYCLSMEGPMTAERMKAFTEAMVKAQDAFVAYVEEFAEENSLTSDQARNILYLRSRSRWTQEKEDTLFQLAREGRPFPNVLAGEF